MLFVIKTLLVLQAFAPDVIGWSIPSLRKSRFQHHRGKLCSHIALHSKATINYLEGQADVESIEAHNDNALLAPDDQSLQMIQATEGTNEECSTTNLQDIDLHGLEELAPLERQMLRMSGLEPYVLVSVLSSTTSYGTITGINIFANGSIDMISSVLLLTSTVSTICGFYSTVVFSMSMLYGKTALGLDREDEYYDFMEITGPQRFRGFKAFSLSVCLFVVDIFLIAIDKLPQQIQVGAFMIGILALIFYYTEYQTILKAAAPIFGGNPQQGKQREEMPDES